MTLVIIAKWELSLPLILKTIHITQFEQIAFVKHIDALLSFRVFDFASSDIAVENFVSEAELILICH